MWKKTNEIGIVTAMLDFFIVLLCLVVNAFFSAYEMAFVTISREDLSEMEDSKASIAKKLSLFKKKPERTLSVIQIGITLVGAIAAAVGGTGAVESLEPYIVKTYGLSNSIAEAISVTVVIIPLTYFSVVFGELVPKTIALRHPVNVLRFGTNFLAIIDRLLSPIVSFLEISTEFLLKILRLNSKIDEVDEIPMSIDIGGLKGYHQKFVMNLVELKGKKVFRSMIPWEKVLYLNFSDSDEESKNKIYHSSHSRIPVIDGDTLVGILHVKELADISPDSKADWQSIIRPALVISPLEKTLDAFIKMQEQNYHMAVIREGEEYKGIITIEDIIEEIVGDIRDDLEKSRTSKILSNRSKISIKKN